MKILKNCLIIFFALFFTLSAVSALYCYCTTEGKAWHQQWKGQGEEGQIVIDDAQLQD